MKSKLLILTLVLANGLAATANTFERELRPFSRIVVSPHINLILKEGDSETIRVEYDGLDAHQINVDVDGNTLRLYLDDARVIDRFEKKRGFSKRMYRDARITAYVTYRTLKHLEIRGNQELTCLSPIVADKLKLKAYGENDITLASVKTGFLKTRLYGQNRLKIRGGKAEYQQYKLYGENEIDATKLKSYAASTTCYGESKVELSPNDELRVVSFGESRVSYNGNPVVSKGLIVGRTKIHRSLD